MKYLPLLVSNLMRRRMRTLFTVLTVVAAFLLFAVLAAAKQAFTGGIDVAGADRLMVVNRMALTQPLPLGYSERIGHVPGIAAVTHATWFEGHWQDERNYVAALAVEPAAYLQMFREYHMSAAEQEAWQRNPAGVAVGRAVAERYGWKPGDRIPLVSPMWQTRSGDTTWLVTVEAIFDVTVKGGDSGAVLLHYAYLNEGRLRDRDTAGWFMVQVQEVNRIGEVAAAIDRLFENSARETRTWTEKALVQNLVAQFGNIGAIVTGISGTVFFSMLLVVVNTMAQAVRERRSEYAALKAIGFGDRVILTTILGESLLLVGIGAAIGLALGAVVNAGLGEALQQYLPAWEMKGRDLFAAGLLAALLGLVAGLGPALAGHRLSIAGTLREV